MLLRNATVLKFTVAQIPPLHQPSHESCESWSSLPIIKGQRAHPKNRQNPPIPSPRISNRPTRSVSGHFLAHFAEATAVTRRRPSSFAFFS